jgi:hypothetical protein
VRLQFGCEHTHTEGGEGNHQRPSGLLGQPLVDSTNLTDHSAADGGADADADADADDDDADRR